MMLLIALVALCSLSGFAQPSRLTFEVVSLKPDKTTARPSISVAPGGRRFFVRNMPLVWLIGEAYHVSNAQISGLPEVMSSERYDIEATTDHPTTRAQMMQMLRSLLEDRFKLTVRREEKELKVFVLVVAPSRSKIGPKFEENRDGTELAIQKISGSKTSYHNVTMSLFANLLSGSVHDSVVDKTGLAGSYDFTLDYMPERIGPGILEGREPAPDPNAPSLYTALQEQLGLKLESRKEPVEVLIVDHIERPSEN